MLLNTDNVIRGHEASQPYITPINTYPLETQQQTYKDTGNINRSCPRRETRISDLTGYLH
jgi:hypothetical protein